MNAGSRDDARLVSWLRATQEALDAPEPERLARLEVLRRQRAELVDSLRDAPGPDPSPALGAELRTSERALEARIQELRSKIEASIAELRRVRAGARGYLPVTASGPALISKDV